ncbi:MAG: 2TM domain-containing protein [Fimbriimonadaceae bacterium]
MAVSTPHRHSYNEEEAEQILSLAAKKALPGGGVSREQLLATANELGIPPEAVAAAEQEVIHLRRDVELRREYNRSRHADFWAHLMTYVVVNAGIMGLNFLVAGRISWALFPLVGWGIGLAIHAFTAFQHFGADYEKEFAKWRRKKRWCGVAAGSIQSDDLMDLLEDLAEELDIEDEKVEAIKRLREASGASLAEAKSAVEKYIRIHD